MNTPAHLIMGAFAFARPDAPKVTLAALLGALAPDLSLYLLAGWHLFVLNTDPNVVFGQLYFSDAWQQVFAVDNSFFVWGLLLAFGIWKKSSWLIAFAGAAVLHLAFDFPLHHDDGRPHFWPLSDWIFQSPISYWDRNHYGAIVGPIEMMLSVLMLAALWRRFRSHIARTVIVAAGGLQLFPVFIWVFVFASE